MFEYTNPETFVFARLLILSSFAYNKYFIEDNLIMSVSVESMAISRPNGN